MTDYRENKRVPNTISNPYYSRALNCKEEFGLYTVLANSASLHYSRGCFCDPEIATPLLVMMAQSYCPLEAAVPQAHHPHHHSSTAQLGEACQQEQQIKELDRTTACLSLGPCLVSQAFWHSKT